MLPPNQPDRETNFFVGLVASANLTKISTEPYNALTGVSTVPWGDKNISSRSSIQGKRDVMCCTSIQESRTNKPFSGDDLSTTNSNQDSSTSYSPRTMSTCDYESRGSQISDDVQVPQPQLRQQNPLQLTAIATARLPPPVHRRTGSFNMSVPAPTPMPRSIVRPICPELPLPTSRSALPRNELSGGGLSVSRCDELIGRSTLPRRHTMNLGSRTSTQADRQLIFRTLTKESSLKKDDDDECPLTVSSIQNNSEVNPFSVVANFTQSYHEARLRQKIPSDLFSSTPTSHCPAVTPRSPTRGTLPQRPTPRPRKTSCPPSPAIPPGRPSPPGPPVRRRTSVSIGSTTELVGCSLQDAVGGTSVRPEFGHNTTHEVVPPSTANPLEASTSQECSSNSLFTSNSFYDEGCQTLPKHRRTRSNTGIRRHKSIAPVPPIHLNQAAQSADLLKQPTTMSSPPPPKEISPLPNTLACSDDVAGTSNQKKSGWKNVKKVFSQSTNKPGVFNWLVRKLDRS